MTCSCNNEIIPNVLTNFFPTPIISWNYKFMSFTWIILHEHFQIICVVLNLGHFNTINCVVSRRLNKTSVVVSILTFFLEIYALNLIRVLDYLKLTFYVISHILRSAAFVRNIQFKVVRFVVLLTNSNFWANFLFGRTFKKLNAVHCLSTWRFYIASMLFS